MLRRITALLSLGGRSSGSRPIETRREPKGLGTPVREGRLRTRGEPPPVPTFCAAERSDRMYPNGPWGLGVIPPNTLETAVPQSNERADVVRAQNGDTRAFERLYQAHAGRVHGLARRMIGPDLAGELTQDVFVRVWEKLGTFRGESAFGTWLHRVAVNVVLHRRAA